jgi:osmotically-inducible protein OsmY
VSHPHAIEVGSEDGKGVLKGLVLKDEVDHLLSAVRSVPGIDDVVNRLEVHEDAVGYPAFKVERCTKHGPT